MKTANWYATRIRQRWPAMRSSFQKRPWIMLMLRERFVQWKTYAKGSEWYLKVLADVTDGVAAYAEHTMDSEYGERDEDNQHEENQQDEDEEGDAAHHHQRQEEEEEKEEQKHGERVQSMKRLYVGADDVKIHKYYGLERKKARTCVLAAESIAESTRTSRDVMPSGEADCFSTLNDELVVLILSKLENVYCAAGLTSLNARLNDFMLRGASAPSTASTSDAYEEEAAAVHAADALWREAIFSGLAFLGRKHIKMLHRRCYNKCWRSFFMEHPRMRTDGMYISRNSYVRPGVADLSSSRCHANLIVYFRYYRFFGSGFFLYKTSPQRPEEVFEQFAERRGPLHSSRRKQRDNVEKIHEGFYALSSNRVTTQIKYHYDYGNETVITTKLALRSTTPGANNRLDILSIASWNTTDDVNVNILHDESDGVEIEEDDFAMDRTEPSTKHTRGLNTFTFVPWSMMLSTPLNLPPSKMDFYLPG